MIVAAVTNLKESKGSSLPAIKKYIAANYKVDIAKAGVHVEKVIKKLVADKKIAQTKGTGANGLFKAVKAEKPKVKKVVKKKPAKKVAQKAVEVENGVTIPVRKAARKANDALKKFGWSKEIKPAAKKTPKKAKKPAAQKAKTSKKAAAPAKKWMNPLQDWGRLLITGGETLKDVFGTIYRIFQGAFTH